MNVIIYRTCPAALVEVGTVLLLGVDGGTERAPTPCAVEKIEHSIEGLVICARPVGRDVKRRVVRCQPDDTLDVELTQSDAVDCLNYLRVWGSDDGYSVAPGAGGPDWPVSARMVSEPVPSDV